MRNLNFHFAYEQWEIYGVLQSQCLLLILIDTWISNWIRCWRTNFLMFISWSFQQKTKEEGTGMKFKVHLNVQLSNKFRWEMILCNKFIKYEDSLYWFNETFLFIKEIFLNFFMLFIELQVSLYNWYIKDYRNGNHVLIEVIFNSCHGIVIWEWKYNGTELDLWVKGRNFCKFLG